MNKRMISYLVSLFALVLFVSPLTILAQEHPEHLTGGKSVLTKEELADAIAAYVEQDAALKGGYFLVYDKKEDKTLALKLVKVHKERLSRISEGVYFACADFEAQKGVVYDLDIFMMGPNKEHLTVTEISVHKKDGKERYTWFEKDGTWHKKGMGSKASEEHPKEHPKEHPQENRF